MGALHKVVRLEKEVKVEVHAVSGRKSNSKTASSSRKSSGGSHEATSIGNGESRQSSSVKGGVDYDHNDEYSAENHVDFRQNPHPGVPLPCARAHAPNFRPNPPASPPRPLHNHLGHPQKPPNPNPSPPHPPLLHPNRSPPLPPHPKIPPGLENIKDIGNHGNLYVINALANLQAPIVDWFRSHPNPPMALVSDFFLRWTLHLAHQLGIPRITFYCSGAFLASVFHYCWRNLDKMRPSSGIVHFPDLPRSPSFKQDQVPSVVRCHRESDPESELLRNSMLANTESWGCVFNSFEDFEAEYFGHLRTKMGHSRVYAVGPLSLTAAAAADDSSLGLTKKKKTVVWAGPTQTRTPVPM
ncbi:UDP-glycosyltransferase 89A2 [Prunus yedoensis var. nudiflora]|uniref:UDP-glycosyltransferase 89A2 n=1 Tax=Prunus yedoensis var. nudiflora TaxID=2094558 RepID=A0A315AS22_PRUYE|nr:UDP-glycosyltransferase 89A2 [Prunus yedoensis var. nudiflora]